MKKLLTFLLISSVWASSFASLVSDDPEVAAAKIDKIVQQKKASKSEIKEISAALTDPGTTIRVKERAAWALGELDAKSKVPTLIEASKNRGLLVRSAALNSLIRLRPVSALPTFVEIAEGDPILSLRQNATLGLGLLQSDKAIPALVKLAQDPAPEIRGAAALAMASLQSSKNDFSEALKQMAADQNSYVQERANKGLEVASRKNKTVLAHLDSADVDIRLFAALYFTQHGTSKDLKRLRSAANSEADEETRHQLKKSIEATKKRAEKAAAGPAKPKAPAAHHAPK